MEETKEQFLNRQCALIEDKADFVKLEELDGWIDGVKKLEYVCINNPYHTAQTVDLVLEVMCPFCGGCMECSNLGELDE